MSKSTPATAQPTAQADTQVTLDEFCRRLSARDRRVELIGGFYSDEVKGGRMKDTEAEFTGRFQAFVNKPV